jgi:two-component system alkaline phosphatase synthesis response regulator PhoP
MQPARKILVIDDEVNICQLVAFMLRKKGFEVMVASDGKEGIKLAQEKSPDLIILDLRLPVMNGMSVGEYLKKSKELCRIPIILLTADCDALNEKAWQFMADTCFLKPFDYHELLRKVEQLLVV